MAAVPAARDVRRKKSRRVKELVLRDAGFIGFCGVEGVGLLIKESLPREIQRAGDGHRRAAGFAFSGPALPIWFHAPAVYSFSSRSKRDILPANSPVASGGPPSE